MTKQTTRLPLPARLLNLAGRGANVVGLHPVSLGLEHLLQKATNNTGLSDFGGDEFRQPLALLLESLEREAKLSLLGRMVATLSPFLTPKFSNVFASRLTLLFNSSQVKRWPSKTNAR